MSVVSSQVFLTVFLLWRKEIGTWKMGRKKNSVGAKDGASEKKSPSFKGACAGSKCVEKRHPARNWRREFWSHLMNL